MTDTHEEAMERVAQIRKKLGAPDSPQPTQAAEDARFLLGKLEEAMRLLLDRNPEWRARVDAFLRENGGN